jgi:hypothetical protein
LYEGKLHQDENRALYDAITSFSDPIFRGIIYAPEEGKVQRCAYSTDILKKLESVWWILKANLDDSLRAKISAFLRSYFQELEEKKLLPLWIRLETLDSEIPPLKCEDSTRAVCCLATMLRQMAKDPKWKSKRLKKALRLLLQEIDVAENDTLLDLVK